MGGAEGATRLPRPTPVPALPVLLSRGEPLAAAAPGNREREPAGGWGPCAQVSGPCTPGFSLGWGRAQVEMPECSLTLAHETGAAEGELGPGRPPQGGLW